jgi:hypothetical protein
VAGRELDAALERAGVARADAYSEARQAEREGFTRDLEVAAAMLA